MPLEKSFQRKVIDILEKLFPDAVILHPDPNDIQGIPDILILIEDKWAALEFKKNINSKKRPNQDYYVEKMNRMSFARFISPENFEEVMDELQRSF